MFDLFGKKKKQAECEEEMKFGLMLALNCELEKIKEWNEETFPDATLGGQLEKLEEEFEEWLSAKNKEETSKEFADIFIVLGGLRRWKSHIGSNQEITLTENMPIEVLGNLLIDINKKMEINRKRVWKKSGDGKFHHKEGTK